MSKGAIRSSRVRSPFALRIVISYLPASDTEKEAQHIGLLLLLQFLNLPWGQPAILLGYFIFADPMLL